MAGDVIIKKARITDAVEIQNLLYLTWIDTYVNKKSNISLEDVASINFLSPENISRREMKIKNIDKNSDILVAKYNNKIIGECSFEKKDYYGIIKSIYVLPDFQNRGVGSDLYRSVLKEMPNISNIKIEVSKYNDKAFKFYSKLGFKKNNTSGEYVFPNGKSLSIFGMEVNLNI